MHINVQSLCNKVDEILIVLGENPFHVVCISETWLKKDQILSIKLNGYTLVNFYCRENYSHGGVAIYVRNDVRAEQFDVSHLCKDIDAEFTSIIIKETVIVALYRTGLGNFTNFIESFEQLLSFIMNKVNKTVILGDFNIDFLSDSREKKQLQNIMSAFNYKFLINEPTRVTSTSSTCIDNILINFGGNVETGIFKEDLSDHYGQYIKLKVLWDKHEQKSGEYMKITELGKCEFKHILNNLNWEEFFDNNNPDYLAEYLCQNISFGVKAAFPAKKIKGCAYKINWFTNDLKFLRNEVNNLKNNYINTGEDADKNRYLLQKSKYRKKIREAKLTANDNFLLNGKNINKSAWQIINSYNNTNVNKQQSLNLAANDFNNHCTTMIDDIVNKIPYTPVNGVDLLNLEEKNSIFLAPVYENEVYNIICSLKNSPCSDTYNISTKVIKIIPEILSIPMVHLANCCFEQGMFPNCLKACRVTPILKKGDPNNCDNYRYITIAPALSKIIETLIKNRLVDYFETRNLLSDHQYGFRALRSTSQAVLDIVHSIINNHEVGTHTRAILCDLSKAFDSVSHDILIMKLEKYGVRGSTRNLILSFLQNRQQYIIFDSKKSDTKTIKHGVPQGSVLGPLLFIIYINDLSSYIDTAEVFLYADDATFLVHEKDNRVIDDMTGNTMSKAIEYFNSNILSLNQNKTQKIDFFKRHGSEEEVELSVRLLGFQVDKYLTWRNHTEEVCKKISRSRFVLGRLRGNVSKEVLKTAYYGLVNCHLTYGILIWGASPGAQDIFLYQKKIIREITNAGYRDHAQPIFRRLEILTLPSLYILEAIMYIHKNKNKYTTGSHIHEYDTRKNHLLRLPKVKFCKTTRQSEFLPMKIYNTLPEAWRNFSLKKLKCTVRRALVVRAFYKIEEVFEYVWS